MRDSEATVELIQLSSYHKSDMIGLGSERIAIYPDWSEAERRDRLCVELCGFAAFYWTVYRIWPICGYLSSSLTNRTRWTDRPAHGEQSMGLGSPRQGHGNRLARLLSPQTGEPETQLLDSVRDGPGIFGSER
jgi:hypothetical protein